MLDITKATYEDLQIARKQIDERIANLERDMIAELEAKAVQFGYMLMSANGHKKPKFVNPDNPDETYSGKGKHPKWLADKIIAGHDLEEFRMT